VFHRFVAWVRRVRRRCFTMDPVRHCVLYKEDGCAFVDGPLCDFPRCSMRKAYVKEKRSVRK